MRHAFKYILQLLVILITISCEKDIDNSIPERTDRDDVNLKKLMTSVSESNGKIWVSSQCKVEIQNEILQKKYDSPMFMGISLKDDKKASIYITSGAAFQTRDEESELKNNPNSYRIGKILRTELTFLNKGFLSNLKSGRVLDFDYKVKEFDKTKIVLEAYSSDIKNREIILRPYDFEKFKIFAGACEILYPFGGLFWKNLGPRNYLVTVKNKTTNQLTHYRTFGFSHIVNQHYDQKKDALVFKVIVNSKEIGIKNPEVAQKYSQFISSFLEKPNIKYLIPVSVSSKSHDIVFSSYSEDGSNEGLYEITLQYLVELMSIKTPPAKVNYSVGESLNLSGLSVILHKKIRAFNEVVGFAEFNEKGITTTPRHGETLTNGTSEVIISYGLHNKKVILPITVN